MKKTAIILGATGLTGGLLLKKLMVDNRYETIKLFSRTRIEGLPNTVQQFIGNLLELDQFKTDFTADEVYCCIGKCSIIELKVKWSKMYYIKKYNILLYLGLL